MKMNLKNLLLILSFLLFSNQAFAQTNPCANPNLIQSTAINVSTATTTKLVSNTTTPDPSNYQGIIVCGFTVTVVGVSTANTVTFEYGSGSNCGTGTTAITGPISGSVAVGSSIVIFSVQMPFKKLPVNNDLCLVTTQAATVTGILSYVIQ
jgi:hypothetical protein